MENGNSSDTNRAQLSNIPETAVCHMSVDTGHPHQIYRQRQTERLVCIEKYHTVSTSLQICTINVHAIFKNPQRNDWRTVSSEPLIVPILMSMDHRSQYLVCFLTAAPGEVLVEVG